MSKPYQSSIFITDVVQFINETLLGKLFKDSRASGKKRMITESTFYGATVGLDASLDNAKNAWPQEEKTEQVWQPPPKFLKRTGGELYVYDNDVPIPPLTVGQVVFANASIGAYQVSSWLTSLPDSKKYFTDDIFLIFLLQTYSDIKVYSKGEHDRHVVSIPSKAHLTTAGANISGLNPNNPGFFTTKEAYDKLDYFLKGRISRFVFTNKANLQKDFKDHLSGANKADVSTWSDLERRLFLLMSGEYYGKNDLPHLNIYHADSSKTYENIPADVRQFWKDKYIAAAAIEDVRRPVAPGAKALKDLLGEDITLQLFAKYVTHGAPSGPDAWRSKVKNYFYYESPSTPKIRPAFMSNCYIDNTTKITLFVPEYVNRPNAYRQDEYAAMSDPGKLLILKQMYNNEQNNSLGSDFSYQGGFPEGSMISAKAFNAENTLSSDKFVELEAAGVPFSPPSLKEIMNASKNTDTSPKDDFNSDGSIIIKAQPYALATEDFKLNRLTSPPIGEFFKIPGNNTILDFRPSEYLEKLKQALANAVSNELGDDAPVSYLQSDDLINWLYDPLEKINALLTNEYSKYQARQAELSRRFSSQDAKAAAKGLVLNIDSDDTDALVLQLWIDSVNAAAAKVAYWVEYAQSNTTIAVRWFTIQSLVAAKKNRNEIAKILQDTDLTKGKPSDQSKTPFEIDLKPPPLAPKKVLDPDEAQKRLLERKKNIDQCALSTNMSKLATAYKDLIFSERKSGVSLADAGYTPHAKQIYGGRFHCLQSTDGQQSSIPNYLTAPKAEKIRSFLDMTPDIMSALTPKIRLYRIYRDNDGQDIETEFIFKNFVTNKEINSLSSATDIEKGRGGGIKSFSFSYEGGTPATAKKDINAELVLFFQSFHELTRTRKSGNNTYKYIDLLLYPNNRKGTAPSENLHPNQYSPNDFKIRADVGWNKRDDSEFKEMLLKHYEHKKNKNKKTGELEFPEQFGEQILKKFNEGLELINKSFLLNMVDHDIDFKNDGSVEIKISYAAYLESALRSAKMNALSTPGIEKYFKQQTQEIQDLMTNGDCTLVEINALKRQQQSTRNSYISAAQGSIVKRLIDRGLQRSVVFTKKDIDDYLEDFASVPPKIIGNYNNLKQTAKNKQVQVEFFFLGDILYTAMDCLFDTDQKIPVEYDPKKDNIIEYTKRIKELENYRPILGSFIYSDFNIENEPVRAINLSQIPISAKFFNEWMIKNAVKSERTVYPLMDFIRDLAAAVVDLIVDGCINKQIDVSLMFQTTQVRAVGKKHSRKLLDPLDYTVTKYDDTEDLYPIRDVQALHNKKYLPLRTGGSNSKGVPIASKKFFDYTLIYAVSPTQTAGHQGTGVRMKDEKKGIYHFQIGSNKGLLKNVKFSKTDMAYLREARFFNQGNYGLLQLGAVYNVTLELFGNTLFYPGMELFIDPRGFGGSDWNPTVAGAKRSVANALGIGGYHTIVKVNSTISPSGFNTTVEALFQFSGAPEDRTVPIDGRASKKDKPKPPSKPGSSKRNIKCVQALDNSFKRDLIAKAYNPQKKSKTK